MQPRSEPPGIVTARPAMTREIAARTGLDDVILDRLVRRFYNRVRGDTLLGPIFADRITDWEPHLDRMVAFWSSVALMTGRYHGAPVPAHAGLPVSETHFRRWLELFRATAHEVCTPEGAAHVIDKAERIASSLQMAVQENRAKPGAPPSLR